VEYTVSADDPNVANPDSGRLLLNEEDPFTNHNGGTLNFGPDGYLYLTIGDGGMAGDPYDNAQDLSTILGKIIRIDVDVDTSLIPYGIPEDNPFADAGVMRSEVANPLAQTDDYHPDKRPEIYYYGLRNAWQFSFDSETGDMYIADVGQVMWEEINFVEAGTGGGLNFGWDPMEASHCYPPDENEECDIIGELPVAEYAHDDFGGCSITGIGVYRGTQSPDLDGIYFAGDYCTGRIWGLQRDDAGVWQFEELFQTDLGITAGGRGEDGELYVTLFNRDEEGTGSLWQIVATDGSATPEATPSGG
jgi:glucose/arabinose dehydrogenase